MEGAVPALTRLKSEGVIAGFGLGVNEWEVCVEVLAHADLDVLLLAGRYTLADQTALPELLPRCASRNVRVVIGGPFNSGILASGAKPRDGRAPYFNYEPAPANIVARVAAIEAVCATHRVPLKAAALQFPLAHPAVACVAPGVRTIAEFDENLALTEFPIPGAFWRDLRESALISPAKPTPRRSCAMNVRNAPLRVDAHQHVWSLARGDYGWLTPRLAPIYRDFALDELRPELRTARIDATVLVQAAPTVAETEYLLGVARNSSGLVRGVVGWVDLGASDAVQTLERLARDPLLKSIRPMLHDLPESDWVLRPEVIAALHVLSTLGLRFDALVRARELPALLRLLERLAGTGPRDRPRCQTGHRFARMATVGGPDRSGRAHPHVCCKLSGLVTEAETGLDTGLAAAVRRAPAGVLRPSSIAVGERLAGRESRRRVCEMVEATDTLLAPLTDVERAAIMGGNARRFYDLD